MNNHLDKLAFNLRLSPYQANKLRLYSKQYNIARLEKRGGVLYAPYLSRGFLGWIGKVFCGQCADLIGQNKMLLRAQRNIKFCANGYHRVRVGKYTYYANASGQVVSQSEFMRNTRS